MISILKQNQMRTTELEDKTKILTDQQDVIHALIHNTSSIQVTYYTWTKASFTEPSNPTAIKTTQLMQLHDTSIFAGKGAFHPNKHIIRRKPHTHRSCITVCWRMRTHTPGGQNRRWCHRLNQGRCVVPRKELKQTLMHQYKVLSGSNCMQADYLHAKDESLGYVMMWQRKEGTMGAAEMYRCDINLK